MKTKKTLAVGLLLAMMSLQGMAMGHPHNLFTVRKQIKSKRTTVTAAAAPSCNSINPMKVCGFWVKTACLQVVKTL